MTRTLVHALTRAASVLALAAAAALPARAQVPNDATVPFDAGNGGWNLNGITNPSPNGGNPGARLHWNNPVDTFGLSLRSGTDPNFIGDYTAKGEVTLRVDVKVDFIEFSGQAVNRELVVILYDDDTFQGAAPAAVWRSLGTLPGNGQAWKTYGTRVPSVFQAALPTNWKGAGAEDPVTFEPILPPGRTWTNVLQGVDRIEFTTFVPGFFYGFTFFNLSVDNVTVVPPRWTNEGLALAGVSGEPQLVGTGNLQGGATNQLDLTNAAPNTFAGVFWSTTATPLPFFGGTLLPFPFNGPILLGTDGSGALSVPFSLPVGIAPGTRLYVQVGVLDAAAPEGVSLSNAVRGTLP
jgi:hypothetical protein